MLKIIRDFLPQSEALQLSNQIYDTPEHWWSYAIKHNEDLSYLKSSLRDYHARHRIEKELETRFHSGKFSYKFRRSTTHVENCNCYECNFTLKYLEDILKNTVLQETGWKNCKISENFISAYQTGDFLSIHTDENRGIAYILNLTSGWKPEYGGMLNVLQSDGTFKAIFPEFNSLILMETGKEGGTPHFVSEVSKYAPFHRVAFSGWYDEVTDD